MLQLKFEFNSLENYMCEAVRDAAEKMKLRVEVEQGEKVSLTVYVKDEMEAYKFGKATIKEFL